MICVSQWGKTLVVAGLVVGWIGTAQATVTAQQKCEQAKLKAQGKLQACLKKNSASMIGGKADASADCQTKFQTALTNADTKAAAAVPDTWCRYLANADGTVSDLNTGLVWEQKTAGSGCLHCVNDTYTWASSGATPNGTAFTTFLGTLNLGTSSDGTDTPTACFTGHCDWRLPTVQELAVIVDATQGNCGGGSGPCIDPTFGPTQSYYYWSATSGNPIFAWYVTFTSGGVTSGSKTGIGYVRAVRGGL